MYCQPNQLIHIIKFNVRQAYMQVLPNYITKITVYTSYPQDQAEKKYQKRKVF